MSYVSPRSLPPFFSPIFSRPWTFLPFYSPSHQPHMNLEIVLIAHTTYSGHGRQLLQARTAATRKLRQSSKGIRQREGRQYPLPARLRPQLLHHGLVRRRSCRVRGQVSVRLVRSSFLPLLLCRLCSSSWPRLWTLRGGMCVCVWSRLEADGYRSESSARGKL